VLAASGQALRAALGSHALLRQGVPGTLAVAQAAADAGPTTLGAVKGLPSLSPAP